MARKFYVIHIGLFLALAGPPLLEFYDGGAASLVILVMEIHHIISRLGKLNLNITEIVLLAAMLFSRVLEWVKKSALSNVAKSVLITMIVSWAITLTCSGVALGISGIIVLERGPIFGLSFQEIVLLNSLVAAADIGLVLASYHWRFMLRQVIFLAWHAAMVLMSCLAGFQGQWGGSRPRIAMSVYFSAGAVYHLMGMIMFQREDETPDRGSEYSIL